MKRILGTELYKLRKSKLFWGMFIYIIVVGFSMVFILQGDDSVDVDEMLSFTFWDTLGFMNEPTVFMPPSSITLIYSAVIVIDNSSGYLKDLISFGYGRNKVFMCKALVFSIASTIISMLFLLAMSIPFGVQCGGMGMQGGFDVVRLILFLFFMVIIFFSSSYFVFSVIFLIPSPIMIVFSIICTNLVIQMLPVLGVDVSAFQWTIFYISLNFTPGGFEFMDCLRIVIVAAVTVFACNYFGIRFFNKKELK